jgi:hypothetical protein
MTPDDYVKVIEAALAMRPTPGEWSAFVKVRSKTVAVDIGSEPSGRTPCVVHWTGFDCSDLPFTKQVANARLIAACHPVAMRALLDERETMQILLARAAGEIAGLRNELGSVVGGSIDPTEVERDIKAALTTAADSQ